MTRGKTSETNESDDSKEIDQMEGASESEADAYSRSLYEAGATHACTSTSTADQCQRLRPR